MKSLPLRPCTTTPRPLSSSCNRYFLDAPSGILTKVVLSGVSAKAAYETRLTPGLST